MEDKRTKISQKQLFDKQSIFFDNSLYNKIRELRGYGLIDEIALRNHIIKQDYKYLRKSMNSSSAIQNLVDKYYLSYSSINAILFRKRKRKKLNLELP